MKHYSLQGIWKVQFKGECSTGSQQSSQEHRKFDQVKKTIRIFVLRPQFVQCFVIKIYFSIRFQPSKKASKHFEQ